MTAARVVAAIPLPLTIDTLHDEGARLRSEYGPLDMGGAGFGQWLLFATKGDGDPLGCWCHDCDEQRQVAVRAAGGFLSRLFIVCPDCGNKRCPKANHHDNACSGSNEPGQPGSAY